MKSEMKTVKNTYRYIDNELIADEELINMYYDIANLASKQLFRCDLVNGEEIQFNRHINKLLDVCEIEVDADVDYVYWHDNKVNACEQHIQIALKDNTAIRIIVTSGLNVGYKIVSLFRDDDYLCKCFNEGLLRSSILKEF